MTGIEFYESPGLRVLRQAWLAGGTPETLAAFLGALDAAGTEGELDTLDDPPPAGPAAGWLAAVAVLSLLLWVVVVISVVGGLLPGAGGLAALASAGTWTWGTAWFSWCSSPIRLPRSTRRPELALVADEAAPRDPLAGRPAKVTRKEAT